MSGQGQLRLEHEYWHWHLLWVIYIPVMIPFVLALSFAEGTIFEWVFMMPVLFFALLLVLAAVLSLYGYYKEAKQLKEQNSDWVPHWGLYVVGHIILSPLIVAPIYILQRWRHIGVPWSAFPRPNKESATN